MQFWLGMPPVFVDKHPYRPYVEAVRGAGGDVPVLSVLGRLTSVAEAEAAIARPGVCDMVGAARALIAEPDLVRNARDGQGGAQPHLHRLQLLHGGDWLGAHGCSINPASYRERLWGVRTFEQPARDRRRRWSSSAAGPAGSRRRGSRRSRATTSSCSRRATRSAAALARLGDACRAASGSRRPSTGGRASSRRLGVDVRLGVEATAEAVLAETPRRGDRRDRRALLAARAAAAS